MGKYLNYYTTVCLACRKPAKIFGGHLHHSKHPWVNFTAGWCDDHQIHDYAFMDSECQYSGMGCYGKWETWMGACQLSIKKPVSSKEIEARIRKIINKSKLKKRK